MLGSRVDSSPLNSTRILKCLSASKEGRKAARTEFESEIVHKCVREEGLQNLDDSTQSVSPQVCRLQEPQVRPFINAQGGLQHATTGLFRS